jgi:hypothetical protein
MSFTTQERINLAAKALMGNVLDADPSAQWYESVMPFGFSLDGNQVWTQAAEVKANPAANVAAARLNCAGPLVGIVEDRSLPAAALRLTKLTTVQNTYTTLATYNDWSSAHLVNWLKPVFVPQPSGLPSTGYSIRLYNGNPALGGVEVLTTTGTTGVGPLKSVGWVFNYDNGLLLLASDFAVADPWIVGFRYIGTTAGAAVQVPLILSTAQRIAYPATIGLLVYDTDLRRLYIYQADIDFPVWQEV